MRVGDATSSINLDNEQQKTTLFELRGSLRNDPISWGKTESDQLVIDPSKLHNSLVYMNDYREDIEGVLAGLTPPEDEDEHPPSRVQNVQYHEVLVNGWPHVFAVATAPIKKGAELLADYGQAFWDNLREIQDRQNQLRERDERARRAYELKRRGDKAMIRALREALRDVAPNHELLRRSVSPIRDVEPDAPARLAPSDGDREEKSGQPPQQQQQQRQEQEQRQQGSKEREAIPESGSGGNGSGSGHDADRSSLASHAPSSGSGGNGSSGNGSGGGSGSSQAHGASHSGRSQGGANHALAHHTHSAPSDPAALSRSDSQTRAFSASQHHHHDGREHPAALAERSSSSSGDSDSSSASNNSSPSVSPLAHSRTHLLSHTEKTNTSVQVKPGPEHKLAPGTVKDTTMSLRAYSAGSARSGSGSGGDGGISSEPIEILSDSSSDTGSTSGGGGGGVGGVGSISSQPIEITSDSNSDASTVGAGAISKSLSRSARANAVGAQSPRRKTPSRLSSPPPPNSNRNANNRKKRKRTPRLSRSPSNLRRAAGLQRRSGCNSRSGSGSIGRPRSDSDSLEVLPMAASLPSASSPLSRSAMTAPKPAEPSSSPSDTCAPKPSLTWSSRVAKAAAEAKNFTRKKLGIAPPTSPEDTRQHLRKKQRTSVASPPTLASSIPSSSTPTSRNRSIRDFLTPSRSTSEASQSSPAQKTPPSSRGKSASPSGFGSSRGRRSALAAAAAAASSKSITDFFPSPPANARSKARQALSSSDSIDSGTSSSLSALSDSTSASTPTPPVAARTSRVVTESAEGPETEKKAHSGKMSMRTTMAASKLKQQPETAKEKENDAAAGARTPAQKGKRQRPAAAVTDSDGSSPDDSPGSASSAGGGPAKKRPVGRPRKRPRRSGSSPSPVMTRRSSRPRSSRSSE